MPNVSHDVAQRVQALTLVEFGVHPTVVAQVAKLSVSQIYRLRQKARQRGFDPAVSPVILLSYVTDAPKSGRPRKDKVNSTGPAETIPENGHQGIVGNTEESTTVLPTESSFGAASTQLPQDEFRL